MKTKKIFKLFGLALLIPAFASCSILGNKDENKVVSIDTCTWVTEDDGSTVVTITYTDEEKEPTVITIPQGETGKDGISITSVEAILDEDTQLITGLLIKYSNGKEETIPASIKSIKEIHQEEDDDGNLVLTIEYTDGSLSDPFTILKGQTGVGIEEMTETVNEDGSVDILITYTDGGTKELHISAPQKGVGISYIESSQDSDKYILIVHYTDGTVSAPIEFERGNAWLECDGTKPSTSTGKNGDYAFDTEHKIIYHKENGIWVTVVDFGLYSDVKHEVRFYANADDASVVGTSVFTIKHTETFYQNNITIPQAIRPGYTFAGWSTSPIHNPTNGLFTDITPVLSDMSLYAIWSAN